jgi:ATP-dependent helicase/nuclease subunit B
MAGVNPATLALLADGAIAVTPNRRLARALLQAFDAAQRQSGLSAWPTPTILPYPTWLIVSWEALVSGGTTDDDTALLSSTQSLWLWEQIVEADGRTLLNPRGAAALASEAWSLVHAWGNGGESWRAWRRDDRDPDDASMFAAWAERYAADLRRNGARDLAQIPDALAARAERVASFPRTTVLAGFVEITPQQERLFAALNHAGATLLRLDTVPAAETRIRRAASPSARTELTAALAWARERVIDSPALRLGIVVEDLVSRREEVVSRAEDILCPSAILPGTDAAVRPFEVSLGRSLASIPLMVAALDLIELAEGRLDAGAAAALLRSPYLPGADPAWASLAAVERDWLEEGRRDVTLADALSALDRRLPALAARWRSAASGFGRERVASPRHWSDAWRAWLAAAGWPGSRELDSGEYQARQAWERLLLDFSSLGVVSKRVDRSQALGKLRALASGTVFQPEGSDAPIQILGVLEASGLPFDALWVTGLTADRWPPSSAPHPMLPIAWQRERRIPRSDASTDLAYFRKLTAGYGAAAPDVIFSSPSTVEDRPSSPSALILEYPEWSPPQPSPSWSQSIAHDRPLESIIDDRAPEVSRGSVAPGGSRIIAAQSDCPFQAVGRHRLDADPWPTPLGSLSAQERGYLVHLSMAAFWTSVRDHRTLVALEDAERARAVEAAVAAALTKFPVVRWRSLPSLVRAAEADRLARLLRVWLEIERARPPFEISAVEQNARLELASLTFRIRFDRIDVLAGGGAAIIDFKTGTAEPPGQWFDPRPRATQLAMYVLAQRDEHPQVEVRAAVYAQLRPEAVAAIGIAADSKAWPGLTDVAKSAAGDWPALEAWWRVRLGALAAEILAGNALVSPRISPLACQHCGLHPLCRIQSARNLAEQGLDDDGAMNEQ